MTTIGQNGEQTQHPLHPCKGTRIEVKEGWTVDYVQTKGSCVQRDAATIFDDDGDGKYDFWEANSFNKYRISYDINKGEVRLYDKNAPKDAKPEKVINIAKHKEEYAAKTARYQKLLKTLTTYGIDIGMAKWVGITDCELKTDGGKTILVLKAPKEGYELELPIDKNYDPEQISFFRAEDEYNVHFENVRGTLRCTGDFEWGNKFALGGNSAVTVIGKKGVSDGIAIENNATVTFVTDDFADNIQDRTRDDNGHYQDTRLKPGTTTVQGAGFVTEEE